MAIRQLDKAEYLATFAAPMRQADETAKSVNLRAYVIECIEKHRLPTSLEEIEIESVYIGSNDKYVHVLNDYGETNKYLVIVVDNEKARPFGYYLLNLNAEYGLT